MPRLNPRCRARRLGCGRGLPCQTLPSAHWRWGCAYRVQHDRAQTRLLEAASVRAVALDVTPWAAVATWAAVLAAIGTALYTRSQARSARESPRLAREAKEAALDQADSARDSAASARVSKEATVDQARSAREALELQRAQRHQADAPKFALAIQPANGDFACSVNVTMSSGPPGVSVAITNVNGWARRTPAGDVERRETRGNTTHRRQMVKTPRRRSRTWPQQTPPGSGRR